MQTALITLALLLLTQAGQSQQRKYKTGERYRYRMTTNVVHNGKWQSTIIATCELTVQKDSASIPCDEVRWLSKTVITANDTTDKSAEAKQVQPYRISLHPKGKLELPPLTVSGMTGEITDFNTFFVAISPKVLDNPKPKEVVKGDFANGKDILVGNDCIAITVPPVMQTKNSLQIETRFLPPADSCLHFLTPDMAQPVAGDTLNNFQLVRRFQNNKFNVLYGREKFIVNSTVTKKDGKLTEASMDNHLLLKMKFNCDGQYSNCQGTMPYTIYRTIKLELLNN